MKTSSEIIIEAAPQMVFESIVNVDIWPKIFKPCQSVTLETVKDGKQKMRISAKTFINTYEWNSIREIDYKRKKVKFKQLKPVFPIIKMSGTWEVRNFEERTKVTLVHDFSIHEKNNSIFHLIEVLIKKLYVDRNSEKELVGLKDYCERK